MKRILTLLQVSALLAVAMLGDLRLNGMVCAHNEKRVPTLALHVPTKEVLPLAPLEFEIVLKNGRDKIIQVPVPFALFLGPMSLSISDPSGTSKQYYPEGRAKGFVPIGEDNLNPGAEAKYQGIIANYQTAQWFTQPGIYKLAVEFDFNGIALTSEKVEVKVILPDHEQGAKKMIEESKLLTFMSHSLGDPDEEQWKDIKEFLKRFPKSGYNQHVVETLNRSVAYTLKTGIEIERDWFVNVVGLLSTVGNEKSLEPLQ